MASSPRFKAFRAAAYGVHVVVVVAFCLLITWNVVRSVRAMTPQSLSRVAGPPVAFESCVERADSLWGELEARRQSLPTAAGQSIRSAHASWAAFRVGWLQSLRLAQAECGVEDKERAALSQVFRDLERLEELYTTHAVQYVGEIGPTVDRLRSDLQAARGVAGHP